MMDEFRAREEARKQRDTPERIMEIARLKGFFEVSLRYRDEWLRHRCDKLVIEGRLSKERVIQDGKIIYKYVDGEELV